MSTAVASATMSYNPLPQSLYSGKTTVRSLLCKVSPSCGVEMVLIML